MKVVCLYCVVGIFPLVVLAGAKPLQRMDSQPFGIRIVDEATGRGVPMVEPELVLYRLDLADPRLKLARE